MLISNQAMIETPDGSLLIFTLPLPVSEVIILTQGGLAIAPTRYTVTSPDTITFAEAPIPENGELRVLGFAVSSQMLISNQAMLETPDGSLLIFTLPLPVSEVIILTQGGLAIAPTQYTVTSPDTITFAEAPIPENGEIRVIGFAVNVNMLVSNQALNEIPDGIRLEFIVPPPIGEVIALAQAGVILSPDAYAIQNQETITFTAPPIPENGELRVLIFWKTLAVEQVDLLFATQKACIFDLLAAVGGATFTHTLMDPAALVTPDAGSILKETQTLEAAYILDKDAWVRMQQNIVDLDNQVDAFVTVEKDDFAGMSSVVYAALWAASIEF